MHENKYLKKLPRETIVRITKLWDACDPGEVDQFNEPIALHYLARYMNAHEARALTKIVTHPQCDLGTAVFIYWQQFGGGYGEDSQGVCDAVITRLKGKGYANQAISCDPTATVQHFLKEKCPMPEIELLLKASPGQPWLTNDDL